jgi:hypothetical protein
LQLIRQFFTELDALWDPPTETIRLPLFGSGALLLQTNYERLTKDSDIFETTDHTRDIKARLDQLAGRGSKLHHSYRMYLEIVPNGVPFLPHAPKWHAVELELRSFELLVLDVVDVVVSKLARFSAEDRSDIDAMIQRGHVPADQLTVRFRDAVDEWSGDARANQLPAFVERFHTVERDMLGVEETDIALPGWI